MANHDPTSGHADAMQMKRLTPDDIARLRVRVEEGYYRSPRISHEIARRILAREDI